MFIQPDIHLQFCGRFLVDIHDPIRIMTTIQNGDILRALVLAALLVLQFSSFPFHRHTVRLEGGEWIDHCREELCQKGR
jgi:hypothetical protein